MGDGGRRRCDRAGRGGREVGRPHMRSGRTVIQSTALGAWHVQPVPQREAARVSEQWAAGRVSSGHSGGGPGVVC